MKKILYKIGIWCLNKNGDTTLQKSQNVLDSMRLFWYINYENPEIFRIEQLVYKLDDEEEKRVKEKICKELIDTLIEKKFLQFYKIEDYPYYSINASLTVIKKNDL